MDATTHYIAETNGEGIIEWVWVARIDQPTSRPFNPSVDRFDPRHPAHFHGAHPAAIMSWLAAAQTR